MIKISSWICGTCLIVWIIFMLITDQSSFNDAGFYLMTAGGTIGLFALSYLGGHIIKKNQGAIRLGMFISVLWLAGSFVFFLGYDRVQYSDEMGTKTKFSMVGIIPVISYWGILWVIPGFLPQKKKNALARQPADRAHMMNDYPKTRVMNIVGAVGWAIVGVLVFLVKIMEKQTAGVLATIVGIYIITVAVPAGTAWALSKTAPLKLRRGMLWVNWAFIGLWSLGFVATIIIHQPLGKAIGAALVCVVPAGLNIRALSSTLAGQSSQSELSAQGKI